MFWIQDIFFLTFSCTNTKLFEAFESKEDTFQTCWVEFRYISNYLGIKPDTFQMFWVEIKFFSNIHYQIRYFLNVLLKNSILFECFGSKSDTLSMFCEQNFDNFRMICSKFHYFQTFWIETRYFINVLDQKKIHFECFANLSNVLSEHPTSFECFQQKSDTFQMFWVEIRFFSNVL